MKINTIHKKKPKKTKKENEQAEFQRNTFALNKFTSKNYSLVHAHVYWSCDTNSYN